MHRPRRPGGFAAEASVRGPGARRRASRCAPPSATPSLAPAADAAKYASDLVVVTLVVATLLIFLVAPFVLWPLIRTPDEAEAQ